MAKFSELLLTGSRNGLLKVWDPTFSEHSHDILATPKLITAAYLLNDLPRMNISKRPNETVYKWDQSCGKLVCSGNVRVCRVWDAWAEKSILDIALLKSKSLFNPMSHLTTCLAADLSGDLIACGMRLLKEISNQLIHF